MIQLWDEQISSLIQHFPEDIVTIQKPGEHPTDVPIIYIRLTAIESVLSFAQKDPLFSYDFLADLTASDEYPEKPRFHIIYNLYSYKHFQRIRFKSRLNETDEVPSIVKLWSGANWAEREVFDMFGINFKGHPRLKRILLHMGFQGHPLLKDYPINRYQLSTEVDPWP